MRRLVLVSLVCSLVPLSVDAAAAPSVAAPSSTPFVVLTETFVDPSRSTPASGSLPEIGSRTLETTIYVPAGRGRRPLIVFAHGMSGHPDKFTKLLGVWARAGYVVAAPAFPLTNDTVVDDARTAGDVVHQPDDLSFVLDSVLALARDRTSELYRRIDRKKVGVGGLSLGGATTYGAVFTECCGDARFIAAQVLDGIVLPVGDDSETGDPTLDGRVPLLVVHADTDPALPYALATDAVASAAPPVWFVTLHGASHASQFEDDITEYDAIAERITTDFWDATLKGKKQAFARLERDATVAGLSSIEVKRPS